MLDIRLLGRPVVTLDGLPLQVDTKKAVAMLAYLVVEGGASRDILANLFWADSPPDRARATLRRTLSALRTGIGAEWLEADRDRVALTGPVQSDLGEFDEGVSATADHGHDRADVCPDCVPHLARAAALYRGDFLQGFAVKDAPEFEDWARVVAEDLRMRAGVVFHRLGIALAARGDYPGAIAAISRWIEHDPLHEPAHRLLMLLHAWAGDRPGAIEAYRACVGIFEKELGVAPLEETSELYEAILDDDLPPAPGTRRRTRAHASPTGTPNPLILGRLEELEALIGALESTDGGGKVIILQGDSWMGKTRLLEEMAERASSMGNIVALGRASRLEQGVPFGVVTQVIEALFGASDEIPTELSEWASLELSRLIPGISPGGPPPGIDRLGDLRLLEAIHELMRVACAHQTTLIAVDDAQWLDPSSGRAIGYLAQRMHRLGALLVIATRDRQPVSPSIANIMSRANLVLRLGPLSQDDLAGIVETERAAHIIEATGGVPMLVMEAMQAEDGATPTPGVLRYIEARMQELSDLARQVMAAASVLGGQHEAAVLREASGRSEEEVVNAVEELVGAGLIRELPDTGALGFTLDAAERITYESTSRIRRRLLHRRAAEALESQARVENNARLAAAVAGHHEKAGSRQAPSWYRIAGDLARRGYANEEARAFYETAIALGAGEVGDIHLALGELALAQGDYPTATRELRVAASRSTGETLSRVEHRFGELHRMLGRFDLAEESFRKAELRHPRPAVLYADWALLRRRVGEFDEALRMAHRSLQEAGAGGDPIEISRAYNILGLIEPDPEIARNYIDHALTLSADSEPERMAALNSKAWLVAQAGDVDTARGLVEEAIAIAAATGHRHREAALINHLADLHHQAGREDEAEKTLTSAVAIFAEIDSGEREPELWLLSHW